MGTETDKKYDSVYVVNSKLNQLYSYKIGKTNNPSFDQLVIGPANNVLSKNQYLAIKDKEDFSYYAGSGDFVIKEYKAVKESLKHDEYTNQNKISALELTRLSDDDVKKIIMPDKDKDGLINVLQTTEYMQAENRANCLKYMSDKLEVLNKK